MATIILVGMMLIIILVEKHQAIKEANKENLRMINDVNAHIAQLSGRIVELQEYLDELELELQDWSMNNE